MRDDIAGRRRNLTEANMWQDRFLAGADMAATGLGWGFYFLASGLTITGQGVVSAGDRVVRFGNEARGVIARNISRMDAAVEYGGGTVVDITDMDVAVQFNPAAVDSDGFTDVNLGGQTTTPYTGAASGSLDAQAFEKHESEFDFYGRETSGRKNNFLQHRIDSIQRQLRNDRRFSDVELQWFRDKVKSFVKQRKASARRGPMPTDKALEAVAWTEVVQGIEGGDYDRYTWDYA